MLSKKKPRGFESLIRLKTSDGIFISPGEFIPVAEKTDLILKIDDYVIRRVLKEFKRPVEKAADRGIQIALDDFGTGYTSLSYLAKLPINLTKIDKSLIDDIETNSKSLDFANAVISIYQNSLIY